MDSYEVPALDNRAGTSVGRQDGLPELGAKNLKALRQALEDKVVTISHASGILTFPAGITAFEQR